MVALLRSFSQLERSKVLVIGDLMLDTYTTGTISRISPEAPVAILHAEERHDLPGGAGNVAVNIVALGSDVQLIGRIGKDEAGGKLREALEKMHVRSSDLFVEAGYMTPVKNRLIAGGQQLMRVDHEEITQPSEELVAHAKEQISSALESVQIVAISDYGKGFLTEEILQYTITHAKAKNIPVIIDPKSVDYTKYRGATLIKPNLKEAYEAAGMSLETSLDQVAENLLLSADIGGLLITRAKDGITHFSRDADRAHFPVRQKEVKDVTGAGDTVLAMLCVSLASGLTVANSASLANVAAAISIERLGCAQVKLSDIAAELLEHDAAQKIFDEKHLFALRQVLEKTPYVAVGLSEKEGFTPKLFSALRALKQQSSSERMIVYLRDEAPEEEFIAMLSSIQEVDFIVLHRESFEHLCADMQPARSFLFEAGAMHVQSSPSTLLV